MFCRSTYWHGETMSTLFPAVKALGAKETQKNFLYNG